MMEPGVSMKPSILRLLAIGAGAMLLTSAYVRNPSSSIMETAANNFLSSLTPEQRAQATYKFDDDQRLDWHFIPKPRKGLPLREMTTHQTKLAHALLSAGLSRRRDLGTSREGEQTKTAIVDQTAYKDIFTMASRKAALEGQPSGLAASKLNAKQFGLLMNLLEEYASNVPEQMAQARMEQIKKVGKNMQFAWAGSLERGGPHYYRVQSPVFLIEYDNTQNDANHIHSVWRDYNGDFGLA